LNENQWILSDVQAIPPERDHANIASQSQMTALTHRRFGHPGRDRFNHAIQVYNIKNVAPIHDIYLCKGCDLSKSHREPISKEPRTEAKEILEILHSDIWGPARIATFKGLRWVLTIIDLKSRMSWIFLLETKSAYEAFEKFEEFKAHIEKVTKKSICFLRTDNGKEYLGPFENRLALWGIKHQTTSDYTPEMNGLAERLNRTLLETTRALMIDGEGMVDLRLWGEAITTANYLRNRLPSRVTCFGLENAPRSLLREAREN
jgi:transposase InsO family protein